MTPSDEFWVSRVLQDIILWKFKLNQVPLKIWNHFLGVNWTMTEPSDFLSRTFALIFEGSFPFWISGITSFKIASRFSSWAWAKNWFWFCILFRVAVWENCISNFAVFLASRTFHATKIMQGTVNFICREKSGRW